MDRSQPPFGPSPLIPRPAFAAAAAGAFTLPPAAHIRVDAGSEELLRIGEQLAGRLRASTGCALAVAAGRSTRGATIRLTTHGGDPALGEEGYELAVTPDGITLVAHRPAGLFRGIQTIRQLFPPAVESPHAQAGPWQAPCCTIRDRPRYPWRGFMLDVARRFFGVADVKRVIDLLAAYKLNRLHLHLTDDQGWRLAIESWPDLAARGGSSGVGGGPGGYYTQAEYAEIVAYAAERCITVVPEIEMPGHTGAALSAYPVLNPDGVAPPLYTGIEVGASSLCADCEITYAFVADVIREVAALTPGPYIHIGGDEALSTSDEDYVKFIRRVHEIVRAHGKQMIGWEEICKAGPLPGAIAQHWNSAWAAAGAAQGMQVIASPASATYLDMKYDDATRLGLDWAGAIDVQDAYDWDPPAKTGVPEAALLGVESPLWTETIETAADMDRMVFPRLLGHAEIGWSPAAGRSWEEYRLRLAAHGPRLAALGVDFHRSPAVPWAT